MGRSGARVDEDDDGGDGDREGEKRDRRAAMRRQGRSASASGASSLHLGHLALAIGAASVVLLIAFVKPGASFKTGMFVLGLVAAFGAWRTGRDFEWAPAARALVAVVAAIPVVGMAVCIWMLMRSFRGRG